MSNECKKDNLDEAQTQINKSSFFFTMFNISILALSTYMYSLKLAFLVTFLYIVIHFLKTTDYVRNYIQKYKVYQKIKPYLKYAKSLNHSTTLIVKYIMNLPLVKGETEVDTFNEIKDHLDEKWPFMIKVKDTRAPLLTVNNKKVKCISSYNYLDLGRDESCQTAAIEAAKAYSTGNHGPRMLCGNLQILEDLEVKISKFFNKEAALVMSSGYLACMSAIAGIAKKGDLVLMDKLNHASLRAGTKLTSATTVFFKHNDFKDAEKLIKKHKVGKNNKIIMVIEGIYSMDGDIGDLPTARKLCDKYNAILIIDEAHSLGTIGKTGKGTAEHFNYVAEADIVCGTFTKAISSVGGFLACSKRLREYYTFYAPGAVFSAPLSAYHAGGAIRSFEIIEENPEIVKKLQDNTEYMLKKFKENNFNVGESVTCVIPVIFRDCHQVMEMHAYILKRGFFSAAVMAPACPLDAPRFRICACSSYSKQDMDNIINIMIEGRETITESVKVTELVKALK